MVGLHKKAGPAGNERWRSLRLWTFFSMSAFFFQDICATGEETFK